MFSESASEKITRGAAVRASLLEESAFSLSDPARHGAVAPGRGGRAKRQQLTTRPTSSGARSTTRWAGVGLPGPEGRRPRPSSKSAAFSAGTSGFKQRSPCRAGSDHRTVRTRPGRAPSDLVTHSHPQAWRIPRHLKNALVVQPLEVSQADVFVLRSGLRPNSSCLLNSLGTPRIWNWWICCLTESLKPNP